MRLGFISLGTRRLGVRRLGVRSLGVRSLGINSPGIRRLGIERLGIDSLRINSLRINSLGIRRSGILPGGLGSRAGIGICQNAGRVCRCRSAARVRHCRSAGCLCHCWSVACSRRGRNGVRHDRLAGGGGAVGLFGGFGPGGGCVVGLFGRHIRHRGCAIGRVRRFVACGQCGIGLVGRSVPGARHGIGFVLNGRGELRRGCCGGGRRRCSSFGYLRRGNSVCSKAVRTADSLRSTASRRWQPRAHRRRICGSRGRRWRASASGEPVRPKPPTAGHTLRAAPDRQGWRWHAGSS